MFLRIFSAAAVLLSSVMCNDLDDTWQQFLEMPPAVSVQLGNSLAARADAIASSLSGADLALTGDIDISISGGGNFDAYYMGVQMVLNRMKTINIHRYTGASAGGMMPFELLLKGENATLLTHLAYGELTVEFASKFNNIVSCATHQDHHWRQMAMWQTQKYAKLLPALDGRVFLALSCLDPILPKLVIVSEFTAEKDQATHAFMATGTMLETYQGKVCSDGGSMSGADMTPLFQDAVRPQLIVNLMKTGAPAHAVSKVVIDEFVETLQRGQDEAAEFLRSGAVGRETQAITLCPVGADVHKNVCKVTVQV